MKFIASGLVAFFCFAVATSAQPKKTPAKTGFSLPYEKIILDNGLEVILHEDHSDPIVAVSTIMHVGSNREKPGKTGFAHFFEHISFNHSENTPRGANRKLIPEWGGTRNGGTWNDGTVYYEVIPKDAFEKILWIDSDRLGFMINTVTKEALAKEIQVVKNEKRQNYDNVAYGNTGEVIAANLYPSNHPYNWTVIGALPDLQAATLEDVKEFYDKYYGAGNATLVIAGDIDIAKTKERVKYWFGEIRKGPAVQPLAPQLVTLSSSKSLYFEDNFAKLPELTIVYPTVQEYHPDSYALGVLGELLTGSRNSPLYKMIVEEKKLAPGVGAFQDSRELAGEFRFRVRANDNTNLNDVKTSIDAALANFEKNGFTDNELKRIKAKIETGLYQGIESLLDKAQRMGQDNEFKGDPGFITKATAFTQAVTREDVMRVYNKYIKNKHYVMTSFVPKGQKALVVNGANEASVWVEKVVAGVQNEDVDPGTEATFTKTKTKNDRSEPEFGDMPLFKMPAVYTGALNNGITIHGIESKEVPLVTFELLIPGGHYADEINKSGVSYLLSQLLMQGTATKTPAQLEEAIDMLGASINIISTNEDMRIRATCLERNFEPTLALVREMLLQPRWDKTEYDRLYKALQTSLKGREASATAIASLNFYKLLYGDKHILGYPSSGTTETIGNISLNDLQKYYQTYFSPANSFFNVAGAVSKDRVTKALASIEGWKGSKVNLPAYTVPSEGKGNTLYFIDVPGAKQSVLYVGKLALPATDPNSNNLDFANEVLGVGSSGRLTQVLRIGKGYTYGASSGIGKSKEQAPFAAVTSVRANATLPSLEIIKNMIADYGTSFTENEASVTKNKILKKSTLAYESLNAKLGILSDISRFGKSVKFIEEDQKELMSMGVDDFKSVINQYLDEKELVYLVVGDKATQLDEVKKLGKAKVVELDINGKQLN
jgi:zinc protease